jgi:GntR family transcriptional regulator / MocR family aminotransferase
MLIRLDGRGPLHRQVYTALRDRILSGEMEGGSRLSSTREMAAEMGLSRTTVQLAYEQLLAEGYVEGRVGSGTYVAADLRDPRPPPPRTPQPEGSSQLSAGGRRVLEVARPLLSSRAGARPRPRWDFRHGLPAIADFPLRAWRRHLGRRAREFTLESSDYGSPLGCRELREAIAGYLRRSRGVDATAEEIVIVGGSQQGLDLAARLLLDSGDRVLIEEPGYEGARNAFLVAGARLVPVAVDGEGLRLDAEHADTRGARLVYTTPSHQYPLGAVLSLPRRLALLQWAERAGAYVLEDDYDGEYRLAGRPLAPLRALDRGGRVLYLGTFSKVMFPALRLGYLVLPPSLVEVFARAKSFADGGTAMLEQQTLADFIHSGGFERHLRRTRARIRERRAVLLESVARHLGSEVEIVGAEAGAHLLLRLHGWSIARGHDLARRAAAEGIGVYPATPYYLTPPPQAELVLGYAALNHAQIRMGIRKLASLMSPSARG